LYQSILLCITYKAPHLALDFERLTFLIALKNNFIASTHVIGKVSPLSAFPCLLDDWPSSFFHFWNVAKYISQFSFWRHDLPFIHNGTRFFSVNFDLFDSHVNSFACDIIRLNWIDVAGFPLVNITLQIEFFIGKCFSTLVKGISSSTIYLSILLLRYFKHS